MTSACAAAVRCASLRSAGVRRTTLPDGASAAGAAVALPKRRRSASRTFQNTPSGATSMTAVIAAP